MKKFILFSFFLFNSILLSAQTLGGYTISDYLINAINTENCGIEYVTGPPDDSTWVDVMSSQMSGTFGQTRMDGLGNDLLLETAFNPANYTVRLKFQNNSFSEAHTVNVIDWTQIEDIEWNYISDCVEGAQTAARYILPLDFNVHFGLGASDVVTGIEISYLSTIGLPDLAGVYIIDDGPCDPVFLGNDTTLCEGSSLLLNAGSSGATYLWQDNSGNSTFNVTEAGTYSVEVSNNCGIETDSIEVEFESLPVINLGDTIDLCESDTLILNAGNPGADYLWQDNSVNPTFTLSGPGIYWVTVSNGCGSNSDTVTINNSPLPLVDLAAGEDGYSCNLSYSLSGSLPNGCTAIWYGSPAVSFSDTQSPNATVNADSAGIYTLIWTVENENNCKASDQIEISLSDLAVNIDVTPVSCEGNCDGQAIAFLSGNIPGSVIEYNWSNGSSAEGTLTNLCPDSLFLKISDDNGCEAFAPFIVNEPASFQIEDIRTALETCPGYCDGKIEIICADAIQFSFNGGESYSSSATSSFNCEGFYEIAAKNADGCIAYSTAILVAPEAPEAAFTVKEQTTSIYSPEFEFTNQSENYNASLWEFAYADEIFFSEDTNLTYTIPERDPRAGNYTVKLIVFDEAGCTDATSMVVSLFEELNSFIPNSFTPDGDGLNDVFKPVMNNADPESYELIIFDRYGHVVFQTTDMDEGWNGQSTIENAYYAATGFYSYTLTAKALDTPEVKKWRGHIQIIR